MRRPRLYWTPFNLLPVWEEKTVPREHWNHLLLEADVGNFDPWISKGASWPAGNERAPLPTAVGDEPRKHPSGEPAGIGECEDDAQKRWILENDNVPPCHHLWKHCNLDWRGNLRRPCVVEKERLMGFPAAYTESAVTSSKLKHNPRGSEVVRACLLGDAFQVEVLNWFLAYLAAERGYLQMLPDFELRTGLSQAPQNTDNNVSRGFSEDQALVLEHFRHACTKWKRRADEHGDPNAFPRLPIDRDPWNWKVIIQFCWKEAAHINELEMRSFLSSFLWRLRLQAQPLHEILPLAGFAG